MENKTWKELEELGMTEDLSKKGMLRSGKHFSIFTIFVGLKSVFSIIRTERVVKMSEEKSD